MRTHSTRRRWLILLAVLSVFALVAGVIPLAAAAPPPGRGPGGGGGGGGGSGGPGGGGGRDVIYADLVYILRDVDGLPIHITYPPDGEIELAAEVDEYVCVQPISSIEPVVGGDFDVLVGGSIENGNGAWVWKVPLWGTAVEHPDFDYTYEQLEEELGVEACDLINIEGAEYAQFVHEVPLSRLNLGRAPDRVLRQQYAEVTKMLSAASVIGLDPSGRLTADDLAIDSSPMNQSIYVELMLHDLLVPKDKQGNIIPPGEAFVLPGGKTNLELAAMALGVAGDKTTPFSIDTIGYLNRIYGIPDDTVLPTLADAVGEEFIDYRGFSYDRAATYVGCFIGYELDGTTPVPVEGSIMDLVFDGYGATASNVTGFAKLADDARRVNLFLHDAPSIVHVDDLGEDAVCDMQPFWPEPEPTLAEALLLPDGGEWITFDAPAEEPVVVEIMRGRYGRSWIF